MSVKPGSNDGDDKDGTGRELTVVPQPADRPEIAAAAHAYEAAEHIADPPAPHRVDFSIDDPTQRRRRMLPFMRRTTGADAYEQGEQLHRLANPTRTAFSVGFGAAAGAAAFRLLMFVIGAAILIGLAAAALSYIEP
ncbi:hypothetical protein [Roseiterribacter gracilis]|uniref:Uncharacterized protein n=1 Tax=Roseiterribacter gracilis TaxID=2812848 RepID=A0A8S8XDG7_9PROT|nr:hypothetical protein TMPK1_20980 [Rhodospirillales bacterium TMPK1]